MITKTCFILAGGESKRFGENKLLYPFEGKPLISWTIERAGRVFENLFLVVKETEPFKFLEPKVKVVKDLLPQRASIVGLYSALKLSPEEKLCVLAGDFPFVKEEILKALLEHHRDPITVIETSQRLYPLIGIYSKSIEGVVYKQISEGNFRIVDLLKRVGYKALGEDLIRVLDPKLISLANINTKGDLRKARELWISEEFSG